MNVKFEAKDYKKILRNYIETNNLGFERLVAYAKNYNSLKVYMALSDLVDDSIE